jgi:molybdenum cofactor guanylyltransferase
MTMTTIPRSNITGLVLSGGRGTRMGGIDKGLQLLGEQPLVLHALRRLMPQVGMAAINANRNILEYEFFGAPVWPDAVADQPGPLAGLLTGLQRCETPYLLSVPCDTPQFPLDLAERLSAALQAADAEVALAASPAPDGGPRHQPVFCLVKSALRDDLAAALSSGERKVDRWLLSRRHAVVCFDDEAAFFNVNTLEDLAQLGTRPSAP